nr:hypothetical protein [Tanacetum cinerariifolium]
TELSVEQAFWSQNSGNSKEPNLSSSTTIVEVPKELPKVSMRRRDDDANKDEEPSVGSDRGSKRRREGKEPDESATAEEPMQTTFEREKPSHSEFETGADDQPIVEPSQHPEWFSEKKKPPTPDRDWNKTLPDTHESIQLWISDLAKLSDSRFSFNELMDTP